MERLIQQLLRLPGLVGLTLGGSRGRGAERAGSDWDFGLYYRGDFDPHSIRALGHEGAVTEPGAWGRFMNGGAWLLVDGQKVDLHYREVDSVMHWLSEAEHGRWELDRLPGYLAGFPSYGLAAELALGQVLHGELPHPEFPEALRVSARRRWRWEASFSLHWAAMHASRGDVAGCAGMLAKATVETAHGRLACRGEWALNEKGLVTSASLREAESIVAGVGREADELVASVERMRSALGMPDTGFPEPS